MKFSLPKTRAGTVVIHMIIWLCLIVLLSVPVGTSVSISIVIPVIPAVYLHFFFLDVYYKKGKYLYYGLFTLIALLIFAVLAENIMKPDFFPAEIWNIGRSDSPSAYYIRVRYVAAYNPLIGVVVSTFIRYFFEKKDHQIAKLQLEKVKTELEALKSQVNPHFLFNTLNSLYSKATVKDDHELAEGIRELSELMRYMIYEANTETIALEKELDYLNNYLNLQKLRFHNEKDNIVTFNIKGEVQSVSVPPMLLIPFVENAFKHGYSVSGDCFIRIDLIIDEIFIQFMVVNSINHKTSKSEEKTGIGIQNVRKRLDLIYGNGYDLRIDPSEKQYKITLTIPKRHEKTEMYSH